jgi:hypothetical protein
MHNISDKCDSQIVDPIAILYGITEYIKKLHIGHLERLSIK